MRLACFVLLAAVLRAQVDPGLIRTGAPVVALTHVRVIDGTGAAARTDQTVVLTRGVISAIGNTADVPLPAGAERMDLAGRTVIPGLVGMHEHLFYPSGKGVPIYIEHAYSFPRLYLASGVTTARTAGGLEVQTDLAVKKLIDSGKQPGPKMLVTAGYLEGEGSFTPQMLELRGAEDARKFVNYWADLGATSFKAYMHITRAELAAAIEAAHARGLKVTGHLCSVGFREAAALGIDNLEHGLIVDTEFQAGKKADVCPAVRAADLEALDVNAPAVRDTIADLVKRGVAVTSTLAVFESTPEVTERFKAAMSPSSFENYMAARERLPEAARSFSALRVKREQEFERAFVKAGGLLVAGADPTGNGSALAGFADQRGLELLVAAGFTAVEAIQIATLNGAKLLGMAETIGTLAVGKVADVLVLNGDPGADIRAVEKVEVVFKDGVGYNPAKLLDSVKGHVGLH